LNAAFSCSRAPNGTLLEQASWTELYGSPVSILSQSKAAASFLLSGFPISDGAGANLKWNSKRLGPIRAASRGRGISYSFQVGEMSKVLMWLSLKKILITCPTEWLLALKRRRFGPSVSSMNV
jgi:hypothetical protein